jgi:putative membrane-bound dehydrogenase-like protein
MLRPLTIAVLIAASLMFHQPSNLRAEDKASGSKKIVFVAGKPSHGYGSHEHYAGCMLLARSLEAGVKGIETVVYQNGWPKEDNAFEGADCVVMYADGGGGHPVIPHLKQLDALADQGVGVVCIHYGVEIPAGDPGDHFLKWIGGYFEANWSVNPHWTAEFKEFPDHPICKGVKPFSINDEWYYHMRFREGMKGVTPILSALPPKETLSRPDGPHSGNPEVRAAVLDRKEIQHLAWASERDGQRGFGFTGGHFHWNWGDPNFRKLVLNAIVWSAHGEVPQDGIGADPLTVQDLETNQDEAQPANFNSEEIRKQLNLPEAKVDKEKSDKQSNAQQNQNRKNAKPIYSSKTVTISTEGHAVDIEADIAGAKNLYLVVTDGGNGFSCDWADWAEPRLLGDSQELKLTELKIKKATADFGSVGINKNVQGQPLKINGKPVEYGLGTHANSLIHFELPANHKFKTFKARGGLDNGGTDQGNCGQQSSVQFLVFTEEPKIVQTQGGQAGSHDPEEAVAALDVAEGLEATLYSSEPQLLSLTNIDIDQLGRVWACEVVNYRGHNGKRPAGDRILICEDNDHDGKADKIKVFYQGNEIDSIHGICVMPSLTGKGTRVIASAKDKVWILTDTDGDDQADEKKVLFSGISGTQHDHGIHAFVFGPDGKLYFNFGNAGKQIKDAEGKPIIDMSGNEVNDSRKPYQEGMVFRCNLDGSEFETLGWNFRNNWEVTVDSFGTLWQSDNDDDGNQGVRINFVMEFGNYGYKDEFTGAGWQQPRTGWEDEIPKRHWHLNDPGSMPNLLQTGQGSPTGIMVYEGDLLPETFRNQVIHCDAGPNIVRAYPVKPDGAGYSAEIVDILFGARDKWFRPSDVCAAPDGSLFVADWYDPGVGGHAMGDLERGRIFRVAPTDAAYAVPKFDFSTAAGAIAALKNPNMVVRYMAWTALHAMGAKAEPELQEMYASDNPQYRARALWLLAKIEGRGKQYVEVATVDSDPNIRIVGVRLARQLKLDLIPLVERMVSDNSAPVRRELAIALRHSQDPKAAKLWAKLAAQHDGQDRWYLEALGIGADQNWDSYLNAYLNEAGIHPERAAWRDVIWRSRSKATPDLLVQIISTKNAGNNEDRYLRAFDFQTGAEKDKALEKLLELQLGQ